jgi:hypothetical protein
MSLETVKCPNPDCGYVYRIDIEKVLDTTTFVRGVKKGSISKPSQEMCIDLKCPNCGEEFEWPIK